MPEPHIPADHEAEINSIVDNLAEGTAVRQARRDAAIVLQAAQGKPRREIADAHHVDVSTVRRTLKRNEEPLQKLQELFRRSVLARGVAREEEMIEGLLDSASNPENRNQPGAAKAFAELAGLTGRHVHIGDNVATLNISRNEHLAILGRSPGESDRRLRELEQCLGLPTPEGAAGR